jgi:hypothetical protein
MVKKYNSLRSIAEITKSQQQSAVKILGAIAEIYKMWLNKLLSVRILLG